jgi:hypothetical protein
MLNLLQIKKYILLKQLVKAYLIVDIVMIDKNIFEKEI